MKLKTFIVSFNILFMVFILHFTKFDLNTKAFSHCGVCGVGGTMLAPPQAQVQAQAQAATGLGPPPTTNWELFRNDVELQGLRDDIYRMEQDLQRKDEDKLTLNSNAPAETMMRAGLTLKLLGKGLDKIGSIFSDNKEFVSENLDMEDSKYKNDSQNNVQDFSKSENDYFEDLTKDSLLLEKLQKEEDIILNRQKEENSNSKSKEIEEVNIDIEKEIDRINKEIELEELEKELGIINKEIKYRYKKNKIINNVTSETSEEKNESLIDENSDSNISFLSRIPTKMLFKFSQFLSITKNFVSAKNSQRKNNGESNSYWYEIKNLFGSFPP